MSNKKGALFYIILIAFFTFMYFYRVEVNKDENNALKNSAIEFNDKGYKLSETEGTEEQCIEYYNSALTYLSQYEDLLLKNNDTDTQIEALKGDIYDNLSMAYYTLDNYETSLDYAKKALSLQPDTVSEYTNYGNALYSLNQTTEAMESYEKAINLNKDALYAYYGKGSIFYDQKEYEKAMEMFKTYLTYDSEDLNANYYYIDSLMNLGKTKEALTLIDTFLKSNPDDVKAQILPGKIYYNNSEYDKSLNYFLDLKDQFPETPEIDTWIVYSYEGLDKIQSATEYYDQLEINGELSSQLCNAMGNIYTNQSLYIESIPFFDESIKLNPEELQAYLNKLYSLYYGKRYRKCIDFGKSVETAFPDSYDIPWYIGDSYFDLSDYDNAITYYKRVLELDNENSRMLGYVAYSYLMLEDYEKAKHYMEECLTLDSQDETALAVQEQLETKSQPINEQLCDFFKENYLYYNEEKNFSEKMNTLFADESMSNQEIEQAVEQLKKKDDIFTFVIYGDDYNYYADGEADDVTFQQKEDMVYLRIDGFNINTDNKVIEHLDSVEHPENKTLVIDLRENYGGLTNAANNILDALLPKIVTCTLIDREGYTYNYYSDASQIVFDKIYVLVNEYTASAAELVTLGLKTYLNNVTVVGTNTFGKGVGQYVFEDKERKLLVYVVNHYWNVRQENIMKEGIRPDILIKSNHLEDYLKVITK